MKKVSLFLFGLAFVFGIFPLGVSAESCTGAVTGSPGACVLNATACASPNVTDGRVCRDPATPLCCVLNSGGATACQGVTGSLARKSGTCEMSCDPATHDTDQVPATCGSEVCCIPKTPATGTCPDLATRCKVNPGSGEVENSACSGSCANGKKYYVSNSGGGTGGAGGTGSPTSFYNPLGNLTTVELVLGRILTGLQGIIVTLALVFIVVGAVLYVTSAGNDKQIELGKNAIFAAMIGLAIGIAAPSFLLEIATILGWGSVPASVSGSARIETILLNVLNFLLGIIGILAIIMLVIGGFMYLTSAGDEGRIETGKKIVIWSIVGITVALSALIIVGQIADFF